MRGIVASIAKLTLLLPFVALGGADVIGPVNNEIAVQSKQEIINLRAEGPAGLRTLLDAHKAEIAAGRARMRHGRSCRRRSMLLPANTMRMRHNFIGTPISMPPQPPPSRKASRFSRCGCSASWIVI